MNPKLLIVDDDEEIRAQLRWALMKDYEILLAENRQTAMASFSAAHPAVVLLDLGLPPRPFSPEEGLAALFEMIAYDRLAKIIVVTGQSEREVALEAVGAGAYDFLCKPVDMEVLQALLKRCLYVSGLEREYLQAQRLLQGDTFEEMLGSSPPMRSVFDSIRKVATTDVPVLVLGESGTGKEMVARAIHQRSERNHGPFVAINCSAIPETLLESELFGHEKGAFTGAHVQRRGRIESAAGGTLFLDEIGEIPLQLQVKLLRFLQERRLARVGGRDEIQIDARIITATNADLQKGMISGQFREDLFYRLAVVQISLPPLRERDGDIPLLAQFFLQRFAVQNSKPGISFDKGAIQAMNRHSWPGNVRELENCVRRAVIMADGRRVSQQDMGLAPDAGGFVGTHGTLKSVRETAEREVIEKALRKHSGKITAVAVELGISRPTLYELMEKLGISRE